MKKLLFIVTLYLASLCIYACDKDEKFVGESVEFEFEVIEAENAPGYQGYKDMLTLSGTKSFFFQNAKAYYESAISVGGVTFTGSSTITSWPDLSDYFPRFQVRNRGVGGSVLEDIILLDEYLIWPTKPHVLVLYEGDNDIIYFNIDKVQKEFDLFAENFITRLPNSYLVLISVKPSPSRREHFDDYCALNAHMKQLSIKYSKVSYINIWDDMKISYFREDSLHLNQEGYRFIADKINSELIRIASFTNKY